VFVDFLNTGNAILGNSIVANETLGIDLSPNVSRSHLNDPLDADSGGNNLQNFPVLMGASAVGGSTVVTAP